MYIHISCKYTGMYFQRGDMGEVEKSPLAKKMLSIQGIFVCLYVYEYTCMYIDIYTVYLDTYMYSCMGEVGVFTLGCQINYIYGSKCI
jgi:hypothetical protein